VEGGFLIPLVTNSCTIKSVGETRVDCIFAVSLLFKELHEAILIVESVGED